MRATGTFKTARKLEPLFWGHGPDIVEVFLEPTCPYSVKALLKFDQLLIEAGEDRITLVIRLQSQPWHMFSGVIIRCILAATTLEGGRQKAKSILLAIARHRTEFEFDNHAQGPNLDATPKDIIERIERYSGVQLADAFANPTLDQAIKWQCKYARQNGIHVSPTFMVNGLIKANMSSGDTVQSWIDQLD